ncbi:MAG: hypothetical protein HFH08_06505 [Bacilli bacterium]|nr:hypothetical protein [Bacilli bacterium]
MNDYEIVKESLEIIKKNGDLYDAIALKEGVMADTVHPSLYFIKTNILLFSRILYGGVLIANKIKSYFSPIQKVKEAQERIRRILGVNIDIIKPKNFSMIVEKNSKLFYSKSHLAILYEDSNATIEEYVGCLKKILQFSSLYKIENILLRETDIIALFPDVKLDKFAFVPMVNVLDCGDSKGVNHISTEDTYDVETEIGSLLLFLNVDELKNLIAQLEIIRIDKKMLLFFSKNIQDIVVKKSIERFLIDGNLHSFQAIVNQRLTNIINENSSYKNRENGKVFQQVEVKGELVKVVSINSKGEVVENVITTLYDYLEIPNYEKLLKQVKVKNDQPELFSIASLHLYLCHRKKRDSVKRKKDNSFYDYIYKTYMEKKKGKIKKVSGLYTKDRNMSKQIFNFFIGIIMTSILLLSALITGYSFDTIQYFLEKENTSVGDTILEYVAKPYLKSLEFEGNLIKNVFVKLQNFSTDLSDIISNKNRGNAKNSEWQIGDKKDSNFIWGTGDKKDSNSIWGIGDKKEEIENAIASITSLSENPLPRYYAMQYATGAYYRDGEIVYESKTEHIYFSEMEEVAPLFSVQYAISKKDLQDAIENMNNSFFLEKALYPVGDDYVITRIIVSEKEDPLNKVEIYIKDNCTWGESAEGLSVVEALSQMKEPQVCCVYGISEKSRNSFVRGMRKEESYTAHPKEMIRSAIIRGLGMEENTTDEEAFFAIKNKVYSLTPIEDAGMSNEIRDLGEVEFYETVASFDSLICNLAALLATGVNDELICVSGFYVDEDNFVTSNQRHDWAMTKEGNIIDVTPSKIEEKHLDSIMNWGIEKCIPVPIILGIAGYFIYKKYGKRIKFQIAVKNVEKTISAEEFETTYAKLKETVYDGIHIPVSRDLSETINTVNVEFSGWTLEELTELKNELKKSGLTHSELRTSYRLIKQIPFIRKNKDAIQKVLQKRNS